MSTKHIADDAEVVPPGELCCIGEGPPLSGPQCMSTEYIADDTEVVPPGELCCIGEGPPPRGPQYMSTKYIADDTEVVPPATEGPPQAETPRLGDGDARTTRRSSLPELEGHRKRRRHD
jgi:hypothetical protein